MRIRWLGLMGLMGLMVRQVIHRAMGQVLGRTMRRTMRRAESRATRQRMRRPDPAPGWWPASCRLHNGLREREVLRIVHEIRYPLVNAVLCVLMAAVVLGLVPGVAVVGASAADVAAAAGAGDAGGDAAGNTAGGVAPVAAVASPAVAATAGDAAGSTASIVGAPAAAHAFAQLEGGISLELSGDRLTISTDSGDVLFGARLRIYSPVTEQSADAAPTARAFTWNYAHLRGIAFIDIQAEDLAPALPALELFESGDFQLRSRQFSPHDGMGGDRKRQIDYWKRSLESVGHLAVVRLDGARASRIGDGRFSFGLETGPGPLRWPMAVVFATTERELRAGIEQATLAFDGAGDREDPEEWWRVPARCGMCGQQQISEVELDLQDRDDSILLRVRTRVTHPDHTPAVAEGMSIDGHPLQPWFSGDRENEAWFVVPIEAPLADVLFDVALNGGARVEMPLASGDRREVATVRVQLDPAFQERLYTRATQSTEELEWPDHLSAGLISSWPNPFHQSTTVEVTVPGSTGEAFDLEPELLARVDPSSEPPFGRSPMVRVKVYNVSGQLVAVLDQGPRETGRFTVSWNGQDLQSRPVASGAYYIHVEMDEWSVTRRVLLLRN
ncbi:hypothetical protein DRQ32_01590 [bacterium]|nr:MAG: hypothetical protein DRQ32_01590 [bacterium]